MNKSSALDIQDRCLKCWNECLENKIKFQGWFMIVIFSSQFCSGRKKYKFEKTFLLIIVYFCCQKWLILGPGHYSHLSNIYKIYVCDAI